MRRKRERAYTHRVVHIRTSDDLSGRLLLKSVMELSKKGTLHVRTLLRASKVIFLKAMIMPTMVVRATRSSESKQINND